jgi:Ca-activated chloride channel family protein
MSESIWDDPRITAYVLGELPAEERSEFERRLASNPSLAAAVAEARSVTGQLEKLYAAEVTPPLDQRLRASLAAGETSAPPASPKTRSWRLPVLALATAAILLLLVGVAPWLRGTSDPLVVSQRSERSVSEVGEVAASAESAPLVGEDLRVELLSEMADGAGVSLEKKAAPEAIAGRELTELQAGLSSAPLSGVANEERMQSRELRRRANEPLYREGSPPAPRGAVLPAADTPAPALETLEALADPLSAAEPMQPSRGNAAGAIADQENLDFDVSPGRSVRDQYKDRLEVRLAEGEVPQPAAPLLDQPADKGRGPGSAGDRFEPITDNPFLRVSEHALSTFSVDVDTASYSKVRDFLARAGELPRPDAVRIEELLNYFDYEYEPPASQDPHPFAARATVTSCPWNERHRLARIALKGKTMQDHERPRCNLVFLIDTSGSMDEPNKLPLVIEGLEMLLDRLHEDDRVAITVYAGSAGLVLDSTPASEQETIRSALTQLGAGGSTNGGAGIALAYQTARDHFLSDGVNRVLLCTDGDFNVGTTGTDELVRMVEKEAQGGIFLTVLGFGMGNHNDAMLEQISGRGNGNYAFIDHRLEAQKVLVQQTNATLVTIAKDVKLQIEFNPKQVSAYRLIGYENRVLAKQDFNDDKKDAGEIGAGHAVTALYEIVPAGVDAGTSTPEVDALEFQTERRPTEAADGNVMMKLKLRYKQPDGDTSTLVEFPVSDGGGQFPDADHDVRFAAAVAGFGMQLRGSQYAGSWTMDDVLAVAQNAKGEDVDGLRSDFVELVRIARELSK